MFDIADYIIFIDKLENSKKKNLQSFLKLSKNRKEFILYSNLNASFAPISCGVHQGSILGPLLFLFHINGCPNAS